MLTLDIFIHTDAVDRNAWQGAPDDRPLTELGHRQAERIAEELGTPEVKALYSSQALRCRASMEPLSQKLGLAVVVLPDFQDTAEKALGALRDIHSAVPNGRAVLCSYGDVVQRRRPATIARVRCSRSSSTGPTAPPWPAVRRTVFLPEDQARKVWRSDHCKTG
jgi:hypothetical protein